MSILLSLKNINKSYGAQTLFRDLSFGIFDDERIGLIGPNGSGKSTLLKIMAQVETCDHGEVTLKKGLRVVYVPQHDHFVMEKTLEDTLKDVLRQQKFSESEIHYRVQKQLSVMNFSDGQLLVKQLSGGWRKRLSIACALIDEPQLLLLDEPTNHLDLAGILWLETFCKTANHAIVTISHDRMFLQNSCNRIIELSPEYENGFLKVDGNYTTFLQERDRHLENQNKKQNELQNKVRREMEWLQRGPKARTTKAKSRIDEAVELQEELRQVKKLNRAVQSAAFDFSTNEQKSKELIKVHNVTKRMGNKIILHKISFKLCAGQRLGLMGKNGSGKTTLMQLISGTLKPDEGTVKTAMNAKVASFTQDRSSLKADEPLKTALSLTGGDTVIFKDKPMHIITWAKKFLFRPDQLESAVGTFSGGEKARILMARMMLQPSDVLLLDEPTNDLDIDSLEVLELALLDFPGAIILVSHDRSLVQNVCTQILGLDSLGSITAYADLMQWIKDEKDREQDKEKNLPSLVAPTTVLEKIKEPKRKLTYNEQYELEHMEKKILQAEEKLKDLKTQIESPEVANKHQTMTALCHALTEVQTQVEQLYMRWNELETKKISN